MKKKEKQNGQFELCECLLYGEKLKTLAALTAETHRLILALTTVPPLSPVPQEPGIQMTGTLGLQ